ncbi:MAG: hypothetical protein E6614_31860 [Bradyrhizobium sp.]|nr:hypothetical protein [Bradyrhizobium sp.]
MTFLFNSDARRGAVFREVLARELPDLPFVLDPANVAPDDVRYMITWLVPPDLDLYRNLEILFSIGAGIDQFSAASIPAQVKIVRMVEDAVQAVDGVASVKVTLVFEPPWDKSRMSEETALELGLL